MDATAHVLEGYTRGELRVQLCEACGKMQFPPRAVCVACRSAKLAWTTCEPKGTIATFSVVHRAPTEAFKVKVPYAIALVDCAPSVRLMMNVVGDIDALTIGAAVEIGFATIGADPQMRPVATLHPGLSDPTRLAFARHPPLLKGGMA